MTTDRCHLEVDRLASEGSCVFVHWTCPIQPFVWGHVPWWGEHRQLWGWAADAVGPWASMSTLRGQESSFPKVVIGNFPQPTCSYLGPGWLNSAQGQRNLWKFNSDSHQSLVLAGLEAESLGFSPHLFFFFSNLSSTFIYLDFKFTRNLVIIISYNMFPQLNTPGTWRWDDVFCTSLDL